MEPRNPVAYKPTSMKEEPLEGDLSYGIEDRSYLDRNPVQPELLPEKLGPTAMEAQSKSQARTEVSVLHPIRSHLPDGRAGRGMESGGAV